MSDQKLTLADIADARAYEREREWFRQGIIALKKVRRVPVGPIVSFVFENRDTIRFQIQEMARAERLYTDEAIQSELDTYNPLIPEPGHLSASMFIELTSRAETDYWLPRLVGIEQSPRLLIGTGSGRETVTCDVDQEHAQQLTREEITAAVHFVRFSLIQSQVERFEREEVALAIDHPAYRETSALTDTTKASLLKDLLG